MYSIKLYGVKSEPSYEILKKYLVNDSSLAKSDKPIMWIHNTYELNDRNWLSFGSRNSNELNKPIMYITIDSLIKKCGKSFRIALIDDNSFNNLIPGWITNLEEVAKPMRDYYRYIGILTLIDIYGGMNVPPSFLCFKDMNDLYEQGVIDNKVFVGESLSKSNEYNVYINNNFIGSNKNNEDLKHIISDLETFLLDDQTDEVVFLDKINKYLEKRVINNEINLVSGKHLGLFDDKNRIINMEDLLQNTNYNLDKDVVGINIPIDDIIKSLKYEWFSKLDTNEIIESNTLVAKFINDIYC
tara:strand:+ start:2477 stop:3373 length:897 start_codon:yes stop_codon:yes gene_type:complete